MYKRRDWLHVHGPDGGDSSDDDDSSINSDADGIGSGGDGSSDPDQVSGGPSEGEGDSDGEDAGSKPEASAEADSASSDEEPDADDAVDPRRRLEDLSEDDYEGSESDDEELGALKRAWRNEEKGASVKGRPLRCRACEGTLILNALALRQHLASKRHRRGMKAAYEDADDVDPAAPLCWAVELLADDQEATETHGERLQRIRQQLSREDGVTREVAVAAPAQGRPPPGSRQRGSSATAADSSDENSDDDDTAPTVAAAGAMSTAGALEKKGGKKGKRKVVPGPKPQRPGKRQRALLNEQLKSAGKLKVPKAAAGEAKAKVQPAEPAAKQRNKARKEKRAGLQPKSPAAPLADEKLAALSALKPAKGSVKKAKPTIYPTAIRQRTSVKARS